MEKDKVKNIYIICSVREVGTKESKRLDDYVKKLESKKHTVHYPPRDVDQECPTGITIVDAHCEAMQKCDEVHILWNVNSKGSHFDLGMAVALNKPIIAIDKVCGDEPCKSYWKVIKHLEERNAIPVEIDGPESLRAHLDHLVELDLMRKKYHHLTCSFRDRVSFKFRYGCNEYIKGIGKKSILHKGYVFNFTGGENPNFNMKENANLITLDSPLT
jgi:nucleoside 2-deoxyribosyltransferase